MASCNQIESMLQARIDGELGQAEGVILDQHLAECRSCSALLLRHQRTSALLFEVYAEHRLGFSLRQQVMENLPEMEPLRIDVQGVNWREKAPAARRSWFTALIPAVAVVLVIGMAVPLYWAWPRDPASGPVIVGVVTQTAGAVTCSTGYFGEVVASMKSLVGCGYRYETGPGAHLMLTLRGPTHLKVDENTRLRISDDRELSVDAGHVLLEVAKDERYFKVRTPSGTITVLGTIFDVLVNGEQTIVTLKRGRVLVENGSQSSMLAPGEQVIMGTANQRFVVTKVDADVTTQWADSIELDAEAFSLFARTVQPQPITEMPAEQVFAVITTKDDVVRAVSAIYFTWAPDPARSGHCSYDVYVYNEHMQQLFKDRIDARVFADKTRKSYEVDVPGEPIRSANVIHIKLVPDFSTGQVETSFTKVRALGI